MRLLQRGLYKPGVYGAGGLSIAVVGFTGLAGWEIVRGKVGGRDS